MSIKEFKIYLGSLDKGLLLDELNTLHNHYKWILSIDSCVTLKTTIIELTNTSKKITACLIAIKKG